MATEAQPKRDVQRFAPYFRHLADLLGLRDWRIDLKDNVPDDHAQADVLCVFGREWAVICLSDDFLGGTESFQRHLATHELLHCSWALSNGIAEDMLDKKGNAAYRRAMETDHDRLAKAVALLLPLPSEVLGPAPTPDENSSVIAGDPSEG